MSEITAYKLFRVRADGSLGPLFINTRQRIPLGVWLAAESHPTPGYALRVGWHAAPSAVAPHLSERGRRWYRVRLRGVVEYRRPANQCGTWYVGQAMLVEGAVAPGTSGPADLR